jgi:hypothetical protein
LPSTTVCPQLLFALDYSLPQLLAALNCCLPSATVCPQLLLTLKYCLPSATGCLNHPYLLYSGRTTQCPLCGPKYMRGPHRASSGNCMVRAADINVCRRAACSRLQRGKRDAKNGGFWPPRLDTRARDLGRGFWPVGVPTEGCCGVQTFEAVHMVAGGYLVVMTEGDVVNGVPRQWQALYADSYGTSVKTVICHRRPLTPSTAPGRARTARGQQCGTIYWQTGRVCLQLGGLSCGFRPPPQLKGWRSDWTPPARTRRAKGQIATAPYLQHQIFPVAPGVGYEGALSLLFVMPTVCDRATTRRVAWSR